MKKRNYTKKQMILIVVLSAAMLFLAAFLNHYFPLGSKPTAGDAVTPPAVTASQTAVTATAIPATPAPTVDPTEKIATFLQGPKSWKERREWSGKWGKDLYDGGSFGGFGCGLCCMANVYTSLSGGYKASPVDMYQYAKKVSGYGGGGAIDWGFMKKTLESAGFSCQTGTKPANYETFRRQIESSMAAIVVVSSSESTVYWSNTPGHYVTLFLYDKDKDKVFLGDSGDPDHNRQWISLKKVYKSLKTSNPRQILTVQKYDRSKDRYRHRKFGGTMVLPENWRQ